MLGSGGFWLEHGHLELSELDLSIGYSILALYRGIKLTGQLG